MGLERLIRAIQDVREQREKWGRVKGVSIDSAESRAKQEPGKESQATQRVKEQRGRLSSSWGVRKTYAKS